MEVLIESSGTAIRSLFQHVYFQAPYGGLTPCFEPPCARAAYLDHHGLAESPVPYKGVTCWSGLWDNVVQTNYIYKQFGNQTHKTSWRRKRVLRMTRVVIHVA
jgi:hypothetical protein